MTTDESPSRIDRVFEEASLINETLKLAPREAIARHQARARESGEAGKSEVLLTDEDLVKERTAKGLVQWFEDRLAAINNYPAAERPALEHRGPFKKFYEEMYSFAHFVRHLYGDREDVICVLNSKITADRDYDAVIRDYSTNPWAVTHVELTTTTFDHDELRRMRYFLKHGWVPAWGQINEAGEAELDFMSHVEKLDRTFLAIERAARRKSNFSHGPNYALVVSFDDFMWFGTDDDRAALRTFVNDRLVVWRLNVATFYVLGISGRTFLSFSVPHR